MKKVNRREFLGSAVAAAVGATLPGSVVFARPLKVRIGVLAPSHCALPILWAGKRGFYRKMGVEPEVVFSTGMPELVKGLSKGDLDAAQLVAPIPFAIHAGSSQFPRMPVAVTQVLGVNGGILAALTRHKIRKIGELKGKRIGVHSPWLVHSFILNMVLKGYGLDPAKDLEIKIISFEQMAGALNQGRIDAIIHPEPLPSLLEHQGLCKTIFVTRLFWENHPCCTLVYRQDRLGKDRRLLRDITLASTIAGLDLQHPARRKDAITRIHSAFAPYGKVPLAVLLRAFQPRRSDFYPFPFQSAGRLLGRQMQMQGALPGGVETGKLVQEVFRSELALEIIREAAKEVPGSTVPAGLNREEKVFRLGE